MTSGQKAPVRAELLQPVLSSLCQRMWLSARHAAEPHGANLMA